MVHLRIEAKRAGLAEAYRLIGKAEHSVETKMLAQADQVTIPR